MLTVVSAVSEMSTDEAYAHLKLKDKSRHFSDERKPLLAANNEKPALARVENKNVRRLHRIRWEIHVRQQTIRMLLTTDWLRLLNHLLPQTMGLTLLKQLRAMPI